MPEARRGLFATTNATEWHWGRGCKFGNDDGKEQSGEKATDEMITVESENETEINMVKAMVTLGAGGNGCPTFWGFKLCYI